MPKGKKVKVKAKAKVKPNRKPRNKIIEKVVTVRTGKK